MAYSDLLATDIIQGVIDDLADVSTLPAPLLFVSRVPSVEADDGEVIARYNSRVTAADIIFDDQKAIVRATRPLRLQRVDIPKIKHGSLINENMQNVLARIDAGRAARRDVSLAEDYVARTATEMTEGVYARMETMIAGMMCDSFSYDKMGIKLIGTGWGMPSDLKVTVGTLWNDVNATPINDLLTIKNIMSVKYGVEVNRITLSTTSLTNISLTTEFRNKAALYAQLVGVTSANFPTADKATMKLLISRALDGMEIVEYNQQTWFEGLDGAESSQRYLPVNKVIMDTTQADGNTRFWDWANATVPETRAGNVPLLIGEGFQGERSGPVGWATGADPHGNPPGQILWAAARGFPRKHKESINACLTVG